MALGGTLKVILCAPSLRCVLLDAKFTAWLLLRSAISLLLRSATSLLLRSATSLLLRSATLSQWPGASETVKQSKQM